MKATLVRICSVRGHSCRPSGCWAHSQGSSVSTPHILEGACFSSGHMILPGKLLSHKWWRFVSHICTASPCPILGHNLLDQIIPWPRKDNLLTLQKPTGTSSDLWTEIHTELGGMPSMRIQVQKPHRNSLNSPCGLQYFWYSINCYGIFVLI